MTSRTNMQNAHIRAQMRGLHTALMKIVGTMNNPDRDEMMVREAGIPLDRALFPLLVSIERRGPIGVVDLANGVGRDYTTVSRQVAKLESLGLVERQADSGDRRVRTATVTPRGKQMTDAVDTARARIGERIFQDWESEDIEALMRLMTRFADDIDRATT
jgi:DNA-binding MarR family transcriptional regulator